MFSPRYHVKFGGETEEIDVEFLSSFAHQYKLEKYAPGRYSWYFVLQIYMYQRLFWIEPLEVIEAIKELESVQGEQQIKAESQFEGKLLKGLWHKHYFSARFTAHNLRNHHGKNGIRKIIETHYKEGDPLSDKIIRNMADDLIHNAFDDRLTKGKLTGEWIVFAKHKNKNYYLALGEHNSGDQFLFESIYSTCSPQFEFLKDIMRLG